MTQLRARAVIRPPSSSNDSRRADGVSPVDGVFNREAPRVRVIDAHPIFGQSLAFALRLHGVHSAWLDGGPLDAVELATEIGRDGVEVVILEVSTDGHAIGLDLIQACRAAGARVFVTTESRIPALVADALLAGAEAVVDKAGPFDELVRYLADAISSDGSVPPGMRPWHWPDTAEPQQAAIRRIALESLSPRERQVLSCLMDGQTVDEIARRAAISVATVRSHVHAILAKLGVNCQLAAVAFAHSAGWVPY